MEQKLHEISLTMIFFIFLFMNSIFSSTNIVGGKPCNNYLSSIIYRVDVFKNKTHQDRLFFSSGLRIKRGQVFSVLHGVMDISLKNIGLFNSEYGELKINKIKLFARLIDKNKIISIDYNGSSLKHLVRNYNVNKFLDFVIIYFDDDTDFPEIDFADNLIKYKEFVLAGFSNTTTLSPNCATVRAELLADQDNNSLTLADLQIKKTPKKVHYPFFYKYKRKKDLKLLTASFTGKHFSFFPKKDLPYYTFGDSGAPLLVYIDNTYKLLGIERSFKLKGDYLRQEFVSVNEIKNIINNF